MAYSFDSILDFLTPIHPASAFDIDFDENQLGHNISKITKGQAEIEDADVVLLGCGEFRDTYPRRNFSNGPDEIRLAFYESYYWHKEIKIADLGNIMPGQNAKDTQIALFTVLDELYSLGKKVLLIGGSHQLSLQQYEVYRKHKEIINLCVIDMLVDLKAETNITYDNHLLEILTGSPNYIKNFTLLGFQSYYVNPKIIETLDRFGFDCVRVGKAREKMEEIEPTLRSCHLLSLDINAIRYSDAPANSTGSPNGFYGDEMCKISRYAGMSSTLQGFGIFGYYPEMDLDKITAKLLAQVIWYFIDGLQIAKQEASFTDSDAFLEYDVSFTDQNFHFIKSKRTNRWWMKMPEDKYLPCTYQDYLLAANNEIPERWLREFERLV